jgi:hypothetical protein
MAVVGEKPVDVAENRGLPDRCARYQCSRVVMSYSGTMVELSVTSKWGRHPRIAQIS